MRHRAIGWHVEATALQGRIGGFAPDTEADPVVTLVAQFAFVEDGVLAEIGELCGDQLAIKAQHDALIRSPQVKTRLHSALGVTASTQGGSGAGDGFQVAGELALEKLVGIDAFNGDNAFVAQHADAGGAVCPVVSKTSGEVG